ncbi:MAG: ComF family protein [Pseudomonadota bacterium]
MRVESDEASASERVADHGWSGRAAVRRVGLGARDLLFPPECPACGADTVSSDGICAACFADCTFIAGPTCSQCGRPEPRLPAHDPAYRCDDCRASSPAWERAAAVALYGGTVRRLVLGLKRGDRLNTVPLMARWMHRAGRPLLAEADLIVPVPLHWTRRLARRFNQSAELARAVARHAAAEGHRAAYAPGILRRVRRTPSQEGRDRAARRANMEGAIAVRPGAARRLAGARVLLVDDVMTSGATLNAAALALRAAGVGHVDALVMALARGWGDAYLPPLSHREAAEARTPPGREGEER